MNQFIHYHNPDTTTASSPFQGSTDPTHTTTTLTQHQLLTHILATCSNLAETFSLHPDIALLLLTHHNFDIAATISALTHTGFIKLTQQRFQFNKWVNSSRYSTTKLSKFLTTYIDEFLPNGGHPQVTYSSCYDEVLCSICGDSFPQYIPVKSENSEQQDNPTNQDPCLYATSPCQHTACLACWYQYILTAISENRVLVNCLGDSCGCPLPRGFVQFVLFQCNINERVNAHVVQQQDPTQSLPIQPFMLIDNDYLTDYGSNNFLHAIENDGEGSVSGIPIDIHKKMQNNDEREHNSKFPPNLITSYDMLIFTKFLHYNTINTSNDAANTVSTKLKQFILSKDSDAQVTQNITDPSAKLPVYVRCHHPCELIHEVIPLGVDFPGNTDSINNSTQISRIQVSQCKKCLNKLCTGCLQSHHPILSPHCTLMLIWDKYSQENQSNNQWLLKNTRACPNCGVFIQRHAGCNHLTCLSCDFQFCFICGGDWTEHIEINKNQPMNAYKCTSQQSNMQFMLNMQQNTVKKYGGVNVNNSEKDQKGEKSEGSDTKNEKVNLSSITWEISNNNWLSTYYHAQGINCYKHCFNISHPYSSTFAKIVKTTQNSKEFQGTQYIDKNDANIIIISSFIAANAYLLIKQYYILLFSIYQAQDCLHICESMQKEALNQYQTALNTIKNDLQNPDDLTEVKTIIAPLVEKCAKFKKVAQLLQYWSSYLNSAVSTTSNTALNTARAELLVTVINSIHKYHYDELIEITQKLTALITTLTKIVQAGSESDNKKVTVMKNIQNLMMQCYKKCVILYNYRPLETYKY